VNQHKNRVDVLLKVLLGLDITTHFTHGQEALSTVFVVRNFDEFKDLVHGNFKVFPLELLDGLVHRRNDLNASFAHLGIFGRL